MAAVAGVALGFLACLALIASGQSSERSGWAVALVAIASFPVVFALQAGTGVVQAVTGFLVFVALAFLGLRAAPRLLALGLIAHAVFDLTFASSGPAWWPMFCAGFDLPLGLGALILSPGPRA